MFLVLSTKRKKGGFLLTTTALPFVRTKKKRYHGAVHLGLVLPCPLLRFDFCFFFIRTLSWLLSEQWIAQGESGEEKSIL